MIRRMRALLLLFVAGTVTAQTTWIVDSGSPTAMPTLAAAVAAAADGDTIVIRHPMDLILGTIPLTKSGLTAPLTQFAGLDYGLQW